jgi:flagellar motility protein MotE (MotC chaperone)
MEDAQAACSEQIDSAIKEHDYIHQRLGVLNETIRNIEERGARVERTGQQTWEQSRANADAIRQTTASAHAILQAIIESREASQRRHDQQAEQIGDLSARMDTFERRVEKLERLFPVRAWRWMLGAGAVGIGALAWQQFGEMLLKQ